MASCFDLKWMHFPILAAARGDVGPCHPPPNLSLRLPGTGGTFLTNPPPDFTIATAINVCISLCCAIGCVTKVQTIFRGYVTKKAFEFTTYLHVCMQILPK